MSSGRKSEGIVSFGGYPLIVQDRLVGVIVTFGRRPLSRSGVQGAGRGGEPHQPRHPAAADRGGTAGRQGESRGGHRREVDVPRQHEPRDPHPDERHHRHDAPGAEDRPDAQAARLPVQGRGSRPGALLGIINDILDFSKIEAGKLDIEERRLPLRGRAREPVHRGRAEGAREEPGVPDRRAAGHPAEPGGRPAAPGADPDQPRQQRGEVHRTRRGDRLASASRSRPPAGSS